MAKTTRHLSMHPSLLLDVIKRQCGQLDKAVLEGAMNAIEAMAALALDNPRVDITFTPKTESVPAHLHIEDKGRGIQSLDEIAAFFDSFGQPHTANETAIWKQFRMGRGQLFSFGVNTWRTATFKLVVDIANKGINYECEDELPFVEGCVIDIDLYDDPLRHQYHSVEAFKAAVKAQVEFMAVPIFFNGEQISTDPATLTWDIEDEYAYYLWARGTKLLIYNLGARCKEISPADAGVMGVIVSKQQLKVNFARNDIQHDCTVWREIQDVIKENRVKKTRNISRRMDEYERQAALQDLRDGEQTYHDLKMVALLATTSGRSLSLDFIRKNRSHWTFADAYDRVADKLMQSDTALCISKRVMKELAYSGDPARFFEWLMMNQQEPADFTATTKLYRPFASLSSGFSRSATLLPTDKLNAAEKRVLRLLQSYDAQTTRYGERGLLRGRTLCIGVSDSFDGWTDGQTYIAINRFYLKKHGYMSSQSAVAIMTLLAHEIAHDDDDLGTHIHGFEFLQAYADMTQKLDWANPLSWIAQYAYDAKRLKLDDKVTAEVERQQAVKDRIDRKLRRRHAARVVVVEPDRIAAAEQAPIDMSGEGMSALPEPPAERRRYVHVGLRGKRMPKGAVEE